MSCQCIFLALVAFFLVFGFSLGLFVGKPSQSIDEKQLVTNTPRSADLEVPQERLTYRPNERDKPERHKRSEAAQRDAFVFPDQVPTSSTKREQEQKLEERLFVVTKPPPCARGDTFCESVDEYPAEHVIRLLRKEPILVRGFFQDERKQYSFSDDVQDRIDASDENPLCAAQEHTVYPKMAKNIEGNWLFVINQDEYVQGVRVEKCLNDRECSFPASLPIGYRSQCKQKYIYRKLVALNGTGQGVISDSFQFPSCCSCVIKLDHNLAHNRFGGGAVAALPLTLPKTTPSPLKTLNKN